MDHVNCRGISKVIIKFIGEGHPVEQFEYSGHTVNITTLLHPYTVYRVLVSFTNDAGLMSTADMLVINRTLSVTPGSVSVSDVHIINSTSARISWLPVKRPYGVVSSYEVCHRCNAL